MANVDGIDVIVSSSDDRVPIINEEEEEEEENSTISSEVKDEDKIEELHGIAGSLCCHPQKRFHKVIVLFLICMLGFGSYYCYDNPGALQDRLKASMKLNTFQFASLYSWYSWPNVVLPIIGGYLIDTIFGIRLGAVVFGGLIFLGQIIFSLGGFYDSYRVMEVGRFVFGMGGESLAVAQNAYTTAWFSGSVLNMVFGFQLSTARLGSSVNYWTVGHIYDFIAPKVKESYTAMGWTLLIASTTCALSLTSAIVLGILDKRREKLIKKHTEEEQPKIHIRDVLTFKTNFWLLSVVCVTYYVAVFPFISLGQVFFIQKFNMSSHEANTVTGLVYLISAFASPLLGSLIDGIGRNISFVYTSICFTLLAHLLLAFTFLNPYVGVTIMGFSYSLLASALWPICTYIIPDHQLGTAFGIMQAIQNLGLAVIPMGAGMIVDSHGYIWLEIFFIFWLSLAVCTTILMWLIDIADNDGYLNMSIGQRKEYNETKKRQKTTIMTTSYTNSE